MSDTCSDPEQLYRDSDCNSLASTSSNAPSTSYKGKKKPWSKFKSSIKSIGDKMSSKPKLSEQPEGQSKRGKKSKKPKGDGNSEESTSQPSQETRGKSSPIAKALVKTPSGDSVATPYVGYQPDMSYAKALTKSGSTSESDLSNSALDSAEQTITLKKNNDHNCKVWESPDSGRTSQQVEGRDVSSVFSVDSDYTSWSTAVTDKLKLIKDEIVDITKEFIQEETKVDIPITIQSVETNNPDEQVSDLKIQEDKQDLRSQTESKLSPLATREVDEKRYGNLKSDQVEHKSSSSNFIEHEQMELADGRPMKDLQTDDNVASLIVEESVSSDDRLEVGKSDLSQNGDGNQVDVAPEDFLTGPPVESKEGDADNSDKLPVLPDDTRSPRDGNPFPLHLEPEEGSLSLSKTTNGSDQDSKVSVEEKLEAYLSNDGWFGPIKDIPVRSGADGSQQPDKRECLYKILVIGELGTGKTSIIKRYVHQFFSQHYRATIGVDFALKVLNWDNNTIIRLQLWDIAGQERFGNMTRVYYKEAVGAFIVFDVTRSATFDAVLKWKQDLDSKVQLHDGSPIPCVLLANKCDQQKEGIVNTPAKMDEYCKEHKFSAWYETSAKDNINIDESAKNLVTHILHNDKMTESEGGTVADSERFPLGGHGGNGLQSNYCSC